MDSFLSTVGAIALAYCGLKLSLSVLRGFRAFILPSLGFKTNLKRYGSWAVVTGCTDGIGKAYVKEFAREGINVVLISRNEEKLANLAEEIKAQFGVSTKVIVMDFTGGVEVYQGLEEKVAGLEIGILVNNVGVSHYPDYFQNYERDECWKMLNVNCLSVLMMTHIILPQLLARKKGLVVNMSSASGQFPVPLLQIYSSTKAFVDFFSTCLRIECAGSGVDVQCALPFYVATKMSRIRKPNMMTPSPGDYVRQSLGTLGVYSRSQGCWTHALQAYLMGHIPAWICEKITFKFNLGRRRAALKKLAEKKEKAGHTD